MRSPGKRTYITYLEPLRRSFPFVLGWLLSTYLSRSWHRSTHPYLPFSEAVIPLFQSSLTRMPYLFTRQTRGPGDKLLQGCTCSRCSPETGGVGAAAVELLRMVDVREARGMCLVLFVFLFSCWQSGFQCLLWWPSQLLHLSEYPLGFPRRNVLEGLELCL